MVRKAENSEIVVIFNKYKDNLNDLIDSSDPKFLDWAKCINKRSCNICITKSWLAKFLERDCLDKNLLDRLLVNA